MMALNCSTAVFTFENVFAVIPFSSIRQLVRTTLQADLSRALFLLSDIEGVKNCLLCVREEREAESLENQLQKRGILFLENRRSRVCSASAKEDCNHSPTNSSPPGNQ
jgi:hypothetical protein